MLGLVMTYCKPLNALLVIFLILNNQKVLAAVSIVFLMLCDIFDGVLFRRSPLASNKRLLWTRRVADVVGDRLAIEVVAITMIIFLNFPWYLYAIGFLREMILLSIIVYSYKTNRLIREPNMSSRIATGFLGIMSVMWLVKPVLTPWCLIPLLSFGIPGAWQYYQTVLSINPSSK